MEIGTDEPARATTFLFSTRSRTAAADRDESEPSSTWNSLTGWQAIPPRALVSWTHTCIPIRAGRSTLLTIPEKPPTWPMTSGDPTLVQPFGVRVPGVGAAAAPDEVAAATPALFPSPARGAADTPAAARGAAAVEPPAKAQAGLATAGPAGRADAAASPEAGALLAPVASVALALSVPPKAPVSPTGA